MKVFMTAIALFAGLLTIRAAVGVEGPATSARSCSELQAFVMSQGFVSQKLKAPASASYPWFHDDAVNVVATGLECEFVVHAYVDSQNSFGATKRTKYQIRLIFDKASGTWSASRLYFS